MKDQHITRLENQLERIVEGAFAHFFGKRVRAQDIALQLVRAMEDGIRPAQGLDVRPFAPDDYHIHLHPDIWALLLNRHPTLSQVLSQHLVELATQAGYRLNNAPKIEIEANPALNPRQVVVEARHQGKRGKTEAMQPIKLPEEQVLPRNPQLLINNQRAISLDEPIINIGRDHTNHIIVDDAFVSRHHAQLRLRFGRYTLFDADSQGGTYANNVRIREHRLQPGDVIRVGNTQMVYMEDDPLSDSQTGQMDSV
jgi:hypothetical protein